MRSSPTARLRRRARGRLRDRRAEEARVIDLAPRDGRMLRSASRRRGPRLREHDRVACGWPSSSAATWSSSTSTTWTERSSWCTTGRRGAIGPAHSGRRARLPRGTDAGVHLDLKARGAGSAVADH
jgi:hypothetical protein